MTSPYKLYSVSVVGNFYNAGRYQFSVRYLPVLSTSYFSAISTTNDNRPLLNEYFKNRRDKSGRRILRLKENVLVQARNAYEYEAIGVGDVLINGEFFKLDYSKIDEFIDANPDIII